MTKEDNLREYGLVLGDVDDGLEEDPKPKLGNYNIIT
jgi:hypothetical protein